MTSDKPLPARRGFFGRVAGAAAIGLTGLASQSMRSSAAPPPDDGPDWPGQLKARNRLVVDAYQINDGWPLDFAHTFLTTNAPGTAQSVVIFRAAGTPLAVNDEIWAKYKIGEAMKVIDPATKAPATRNLFARPGLGVARADDRTLAPMLTAGVIMGACNQALHGLSKMLAHNAGVSADDAAREWIANVIPGITVIPSGVWGLGRAQQAGCGYCSGG